MAVNKFFPDDNYFWSLFPEYFKRDDTYKDVNGKGLLERYLKIFPDELRDGIQDQLLDFLNQIDPATCDDKFLAYIAYLLGNPPDLTLNLTDYRKLLQHIIAIYKIKGTELSYDLLFAIYGLSVTIQDLTNPGCVYDSGFHYDAGDVDYNGLPLEQHYDSSCEPCSEYDILISSKQDNCSIPIFQDIDEEYLKRILQGICLLEPINANLRFLIRDLKICEKYNTSGITGNVVISLLNAIKYDDGHLYDNSEIYDSTALVSTITVPGP